MQVILLEKINHLGDLGDIVKVKVTEVFDYDLMGVLTSK